MSTATQSPPRPICEAPAPLSPRCGWCNGTGEQDDEDCGQIACYGCAGSGEGDWVPACEFVLNPMHAHPKPGQRVAVYDPSRSRLSITLRKKVEHYTVFEIDAAPGFGRGFQLFKVDAKGAPVEENGRPVTREFQTGPDGTTCSCQGGDYLSNAKANQRAWEDGRDVHPSYGCKHADAMVPLMKAGWLDLGEGRTDGTASAR